LLASASLPVLPAPTAQAQAIQAMNHIPVCPGPQKDTFNCHARVVTDDRGSPNVTKEPAGYGPAQFRGAYRLPRLAGATQTIAIVDAYDHPNILADLNTYSAQFGLPTMKDCGTGASPCFQKIDQRGGKSYPRTDAGWALEISLDVEIAHAVCQNCNILL